jgi:PAS domain S-box-containing protein
MWIYDLETLRFLEVNEAAVKHYGYPRAEFLRMRISDILPKEDVARLKAHVQTKRLRPQNSGEGRHLKKDGTIIYVDIISHKLIYKEHKAALIVVNDVTEYKQTRSALKESQAEFSDIIATAMDAITIIDERQRIVVFNPAAEKMFQRSAAQVIGEPLSLVIPDRFRKSHQGYVAEFGKSGATTRSAAHLGQFIGLRADGSEFPIEISISSVESSGQRRYTAIVRDISERVRAEETLRESEERLRSLYQITSKLAAQSDVSTLLKMISDDVAALLDVSGGVVHLYDSQRSEMEAVASTDPIYLLVCNHYGWARE